MDPCTWVTLNMMPNMALVDVTFQKEATTKESGKMMKGVAMELLPIPMEIVFRDIGMGGWSGHLIEEIILDIRNKVESKKKYLIIYY